MTTTEHDPATVGAEGLPQTGKRVFATELVAGDGRTVDLRIVPYGERAKANDGLGGLPLGVMYEEEILPGAFDHQLNAAFRVLMNVEHEPGILGVVGKGVSLASRSDGLYGSFKFLETNAGETALALVKEGALGGVSFEAKFKKSMRAASGVVQRVKANLVNVALCRDPAYANAVVLGLREDPDQQDTLLIDESLLPPQIDRDLATRIAALGVSLPDRIADDLALRAFTEIAWDGSSSRWDTAAAYCAACAIDDNPAGQPKTKSRCHLPFKEPGSGDINVHAVQAALARIGQGFPQDVSPAQRDSARAMLERMLTMHNQQQ